jgi:trk system potassium uptake protein TrkH
MFRRRLPPAVVRQATTLALLSVALVVAATITLMSFDRFTLLSSLFEVTSAFGTTGLTTGITPLLGTTAELLIVVIMLAGRIGPTTFITAIALRERHRAYRFPEEQPLIA